MVFNKIKMSQTTRAQVKKSIAPFAVGALEVIRNNLNMGDKPLIVESGGTNWYLHKSGEASFLVKRQNYTNIKELPKGRRIYEEAVVCSEGGGFSVQGYMKRAF